MGGLPFQFLVGLLAMIGVSELLRMRRLEIFSFEGALAMIGAFVLTVPLDSYLSFYQLTLVYQHTVLLFL